MYYGKKVLLRAYEKEDIKEAHRFFNDLEVQRNLSPGTIFPISYEEEENFITNSSNNKNVKYNFAIATKKDKKYIGGCGYFNHHSRNRTVTIGIAIANKQYWGKGYGTDAMKLLIDFLFNELNVRKISLSAFAFNQRAINLYKKLKFKEEGILKKHFYRDGQYHDEIIMCLFKNDYQQDKDLS